MSSSSLTNCPNSFSYTKMNKKEAANKNHNPEAERGCVCTVKCHTVTDVFIFVPAPQSPAVIFNLNEIQWQHLGDKMAGGESFGSLHSTPQILH